MKSAKYIAFIFSLSIFASANAQEKMMNYEGSSLYHYGFIIAHRSNMKVLVKDYTKIVEFDLAKQFLGKNDWEIKYNHPYAGIGLMMFDFGNPEQLGKGMSLMAFMNFPLVRTKNFEFNFKFGFGPGYVEKVFDIKDNYKNFAVSTHFNGFAHGNFNARYTIKKRIIASAGLSISHFSNAAAKKPNLGMNIPALNAGIGYRFIEGNKETRESNYAFEYSKDWHNDIVLAFGRKSNGIGEPRNPVVTLAYGLSKHVSFKSKLGVGGDFFYNTAHKGKNDGNGNEIDSPVDISQLGANFSYTLQIDKFSLFLVQGVYLYTKFKEDGSLYNRFGMRYLIKDHFIINLSMKTHFAVADHVEMGLGYRF